MNKIINKNGKVFGKINLLDAIVVLILIIALLGVAYKFFVVDDSTFMPDYQQGEITLKLTGLDENKYDAIKIGDMISVPKIQQLGEVTHIEVQHRIDNVSSADGKVYTIENPLFYELIVTLKTSKLYQKDNYYYLDKNYKIISGQALDVSNGVLPCKASIISINKKEDR